MYLQVATAAVGSLCYAEDDGRHYLGVKAAVVTKAGRNQFCCYVLECDSEVKNGKYIGLQYESHHL